MVVALAAPLAAADRPMESVGFVLDVAGQWTLDGAPAAGLRVGQALPAGATLRARAAQPRWRIVIALSDGSTLARTCGEPVGACGEALTMPAAAHSQTGFWGRALAAASSLFAHPQERYASTLSRGGGGEDGVARLEAGALSVEGVLAGLPAGSYQVTLRPLASQIEAVASSYKAPGGGHLAAPGLKPGLYELRASPQTDPDRSSSVWVLVVEPAAYQAAWESFESARATANSWATDARAAAVRSFLRAYLEELANQMDARKEGRVSQ